MAKIIVDLKEGIENGLVREISDEFMKIIKDKQIKLFGITNEFDGGQK